MPLVVATYSMQDGYGDLLFGLRMASDLKKAFGKQGYKEECYLVTSKASKETIARLKGDKEFGVTVLTDEEFEKLSADKKNFKIDYFISGPVKTQESLLNRVPKTTPMMFVPEYNFNYGNWHEEYKKTYSNRMRQCQAVSTGLDEKGDKGIFISSELANVSDPKNKNKALKEDYWKKLKADPGLNNVLFNNQSIEEYTKGHKLCFQYASQNSSQEHYEEYLRCNLLYMRGSNTPIDFLCLGGDAKEGDKEKKQALQKYISQLKKDGFTQVIFINKEGKEEILFHDKNAAQQKCFRCISYKGLSHPQMMALFAVSEDVVGVTGDQSVSEAFSARKIPIYEARGHKQNFCDMMSRLAQSANHINTSCDLIQITTLPTLKTLQQLKLRSNAAYIRCGRQLYYANQATNQLITIDLNDKQRLQFDALLGPTTHAVTLSDQQLSTIETLTDHAHHTNYIASLFDEQTFNKDQTQQKMQNLANTIITQFNLSGNIVQIMQPELSKIIDVKTLAHQMEQLDEKTSPKTIYKLIHKKLLEAKNNQDLCLFRYLMEDLPDRFKPNLYELILLSYQNELFHKNKANEPSVFLYYLSHLLQENKAVLLPFIIFTLEQLPVNQDISWLKSLIELNKTNPEINHVFEQVILTRPSLFEQKEIYQTMRPLVSPDMQLKLDQLNKKLSVVKGQVSKDGIFGDNSHSASKSSVAKNDAHFSNVLKKLS